MEFAQARSVDVVSGAGTQPASTFTDAAAADAAMADDVGDDGLSRRDRDILTFERQWWRYAGAKEQAIRELFSMSP
ncbi:MAG: DUF3263 domain-containing protein, partial [Actinomycetia bacterium]|nr:DUF3263 domain-containing protein [Actinomycetes bacterium]